MVKKRLIFEPSDEYEPCHRSIESEVEEDIGSIQERGPGSVVLGPWSQDLLDQLLSDTFDKS